MNNVFRTTNGNSLTENSIKLVYARSFHILELELSPSRWNCQYLEGQVVYQIGGHFRSIFFSLDAIYGNFMEFPVTWVTFPDVISLISTYKLLLPVPLQSVTTLDASNVIWYSER